ncbi:helix-turn-helix domain-containing protein [Ralstonia sp. 25C]|uniref:helix-turn-helix domain-containing protein n=1 Tax=Ralstonia sp. 25C TaxID=3447363 RepID=UPI003F7554DA
MNSATPYLALGERIRSLRAAAGIATQAELAQRLGDTSQQSVSRWEAGTSRPRAHDVAKLAAVLKTDVTELARAAGYSPEPATVSFDQLLPLPSLLPEGFEHFCLDLLATHLRGRADVHPAGKTGHKQYGIDIEAQFASGLHTYQCKREAQFGPDKVKRAIQAQTLSAKKKHILLSRVASPGARNAIRQVRGWGLWDQADITRVFRTLPKQEQVRIVDIYFPTQRFALTGELAAGPWQTVEAFFAPQLVEGRFFNQCWELVGRSAELSALAQALSDQSVLAVSLVGRAGEGKSRVLRSALDAFATQHPEVRILVASPTEDITAKSLEDLGADEKLLVVDDVHERNDRNDLVQLIRYAGTPGSRARLLLVYRPYWSDIVSTELARYGLSDNLIRSITLTSPTKQEGIALATQVLAKNGVSTEAAQAIAAVGYDSPLAVVVGAKIVASEGLHPELFGSHDVFRAMVLKRYESVFARDIAQGRDQERVHKMLRVLALIQPVVPDDRHVLKLITDIEAIDVADASRLIGLLVGAGVLFKRGARYRLSPDLLADSIIESACITPSGASNGYAEGLFAEAVPEHKEHVLLNLGRLDWRRNEGDTSDSTLLDGLWSQIAWADDYVNAQVKAAVAAAYFQPRQALLLARRLIDEGHGQNSIVCRVIHGATYSLKHLAQACALLWEVGQHDARQTNSHPHHAIRLLTELATPDPRKPVEFVMDVVDFMLSLLDYPESWTGAYTPFYVLKGGLATEGHFTSAATSREITISTYRVSLERIQQVRQRIIDALLFSLSSANQRRAFLAAQHLSEALRGPMGACPDSPDSWGAEFVQTLEKINALLETVNVTAPVVVAVGESVQWHAFHGLEYTKVPAQRILTHLSRDLDTRTVRAFIDAWGTRTWPLGEQGGRRQHQADMDALCLELSTQFPEPDQLASFLQERLADITRATGATEHGAAQLFLGRVLESNLSLARYLVQCCVHGESSQLSPYTGRALGALLTGAKKEGSAFVESLLAQGDAHLPIVAAGYLFAAGGIAPYSALDVRALKLIFSSQEGPVLRCVPHLVRDVARTDKGLAIELITRVDTGCILSYARDFFAWVHDDKEVPFDLVTDDQLREMIGGLRQAKELDDYWVHAFLKKAIQRIPRAVVELAMARVEDAIDSGDGGTQPLGDVPGHPGAFGLMLQPQGRELFHGLLDWAISRITDYDFSYRFGELIEVLCGPYDAACVAALEEWLAGGTQERFAVVRAILRTAGQRFIYAHEGFVERALGAARSVGRSTYRDLSSVIFQACVSGVRSGAPGQPFVVDLDLKDMATRRLALITKANPAFDLYQRLLDYATREIERQEEQGRRMDEEDADM